MKKIFRVMYASDTEGAEFEPYKLKEIDYQWYEEGEDLRSENVKLVLWEEFLNTFLDHVFP